MVISAVRCGSVVFFVDNVRERGTFRVWQGFSGFGVTGYECKTFKAAMRMADGMARDRGRYRSGDSLRGLIISKAPAGTETIWASGNDNIVNPHTIKVNFHSGKGEHDAYVVTIETHVFERVIFMCTAHSVQHALDIGRQWADEHGVWVNYEDTERV